jgi:hypothetical protein
LYGFFVSISLVSALIFIRPLTFTKHSPPAGAKLKDQARLKLQVFSSLF